MAESENTAVPQETTEGQTETGVQSAEEKMTEQFTKEEGKETTQTEGETADEGKPAEEDKPDETEVPIGDDWTPTLPEGTSIDEDTIKEARTLLKEMGLSSDKAQKLAEFQIKQVQAIQAKTAEAWEKQVSDWESAVKKDPMFKDNFEAKKVIAEKGFKELFTPEEREWLSKTGISSYLFRAMFKAGESIAEPQGEIESKRGKMPRSDDPYAGLETMFGRKK